MSQQELDRTDQEVMELVNGAASPEASENADRLADELWGTTAQEAKEQEAELRAKEQREKEQKKLLRFVRKQKCIKILGVMACVLIASLLVAAMFFPKLVTWVANVGVLTCGIVAAMIVERLVRGY